MIQKVLISPYSRRLRNGNKNPKDYCYWPEVVSGLKAKGVFVCQIGVSGEVKLDGVNEFLTNKPLKELKKLLEEFDTWISVDNFLNHFAWSIGKPGVVIFGQSDPNIYGHKENVNLLKDRSYLRLGIQQFQTWEEAKCNNECFVGPEVVVDAALGVTQGGKK